MDFFLYLCVNKHICVEAILEAINFIIKNKNNKMI